MEFLAEQRCLPIPEIRVQRVFRASSTKLQTGPKAIPAEEFEDFGSMLIFDHALSPLVSRNSDDISLGLIEAIEDGRHCAAQRGVEKPLSINAEQVSAGVFEGHTLAVVVNTVPPLVVFDVVFQAVKDAIQIFGRPCDR